MKAIAILGSTGSIGRAALDVVRKNPGRFRVLALSAGKNISLLERQIREFRPRFVSVLDRTLAGKIRSKGVVVGYGAQGVKTAATCEGVDMVVAAIVGAAGFLPTLSAIRAGSDIALANKETLVMGGEFIMREARKNSVNLIPVDSEHSAVFQALKAGGKKEISRIILTASGGPFLSTPLRKLRSVAPNEALRHPTWRMGRRITVDSATLMNKGFEVMEARWLFDCPAENIEVCIHPQSVVHSMVEFIDGSMVAQMGSSDMRVPIAYALSYPERMRAGGRFDIFGKRLDFRKPDTKRFPCLTLAYSALESGGTAGAVLNAADEVCVEMFLKGAVRFTDIPEVIEETLERHRPGRIAEPEDIMEADRAGRALATEIARERKKC